MVVPTDGAARGLAGGAAGAPEGEVDSGAACEANAAQGPKAQGGAESAGAAGAAGNALPAPLQAVELKPLGEALAGSP